MVIVVNVGCLRVILFFFAGKGACLVIQGVSGSISCRVPPQCGSGLARDSGGAVLQANQGDAIASKPAPTDSISPARKQNAHGFRATGVLCFNVMLMGDR